MGHNEEIRVHSRWSTALECFSTPAVSLKRLLTGKGMRTNSEGEEGLTKKKRSCDVIYFQQSRLSAERRFTIMYS